MWVPPVWQSTGFTGALIHRSGSRQPGGLTFAEIPAKLIPEMNDTLADISEPYPEDFRPRLRPVEVHPHQKDGEQLVALHDPTGLSDVGLTMSLPALRILSLMDGTRTLADIRAEFSEHFDQALSPETLLNVVGNLDQAHYLEGGRFERFYDTLVQEYVSAEARPMKGLAGLGLADDRVSQGMDELFNWPTNERNNGQIAGLIAPHLDYPRGQPCYLQAYSALSGHAPHRRFVILGTNHFGRSAAVVGTAQTFQTPLGKSRVDTDFLERMESKCGGTLRGFELDHKREHSIELQVLVLQHLFGDQGFTIVPFLCPDPCGPSGTAPVGQDGVDLKVFAETLGELIRDDPAPTCIIAAADLSHIGQFFGDDRELDGGFLDEVQARDQAALQYVADGDAEGFRGFVGQNDNPTRICSAGCIYSLLVALPQAQPRLLKYHQATDHEQQCTVTCTAALFETR